MATLTEQLISKMGLRDEPNALAKAHELIRLLELRSTNIPLQINDYAKIVLCTHIATEILEIGIDKEQALKLSGLRKSHYATQKRLCEKLLDLNKIVGVKDICIQLGIDEIAKKARELLDLYKATVSSENSDIDLTHPQYAAMAVFYACKLFKRKLPKTKLMPYSNLKPTQWLQLEQRWDKFMTKHSKIVHASDQLKQLYAVEDDAAEDKGSVSGQQDGGGKLAEKCQVEDYEIWKQRMLLMAQSRLQALRDKEHIEKETIA